MKNDTSQMNRISWLRLIAAMMLAVSALCPLQAVAQMPARFYWKTLAGANAVPLIFESMSGNTNPFDPAHTVTPGANFNATLGISGYARTFSLFERAAMAAVIVPMGRLSGEVTVAGNTVNQAVSGFGDPMIELNLNIIGPRVQKDIPDLLRYEPGFSVDLLADVAFPIGEYDSSQPLNIGLNRWYGRIGLPIVWQLGAWVPGRRTTLEFLPAVWLFGDNDDYVGQTLKTDPMFQLDAHLTRDFSEHFWAALDSAWYTGGQASINGVEGDELNNFGVGLTLGYTLTDSLALTCGYMSTLSDDDPEDLQMDNFKVSLVYGWHPLIEGMGRLEEKE